MRDESSIPATNQEPESPVAVSDAPSAPMPQGILATNTGVRLACTIAAMISLFALFLCWAEKDSRVIRRFAVQSAALLAAHLSVAAAAMLLSLAFGWIPYFGVMVTLMCWLSCISAFILALILRVRLMERAWHGQRFSMPAAAEKFLARFY